MNRLLTLHTLQKESTHVSLRDDERQHLRDSLVAYMGKNPAAPEPVFVIRRDQSRARLLIICGALIVLGVLLILRAV